MAGYPSTQGSPASSDAQHGRDRQFPEGSSTDIPVTSGLPADHATAVGSPVQPEIRQDRPIPDMGMGYHQAGEDDPY